MVSRIAVILHWMAQRLAGSPLRAGISATTLCLAGGLVSSQVIFQADLRDRETDGYFQIADSLLLGNGYRVAPDRPPATHRPPVFTLICVPFAALPRAWALLAFIVFQSLLMGMTAALTHRIATHLAGPRPGALSALIFMSHPGLLLCAPVPTPWYWEMVLYTCLGWLLVVAVQLDSREALTQRGRALVGLGLGVLFGALCLTHGAKLLTVPLVLLALSGGAILSLRVRWLPSLGLAALLCGLMIAPWAYRNWLVLGRFVPLATNSGFAFFLGDAQWGMGEIAIPPDEAWRLTGMRCARLRGSPDQCVEFWALKDPNSDRLADRHMWDRIQRHPDEVAFKVALNAADQFLPVTRFIYRKLNGLTLRTWDVLLSYSQFQKAAMMSLFNAALLLAASCGLPRSFRTFRPPGFAWILLAMIAAFCLPYYPFLVSAQTLCNYTFAVLPLLSVFAAMAFEGGAKAVPAANSCSSS